MFGLVRTRAVAKPGVHVVLERVRRRGLAVALASSSAPSIIDAVLETLALAPYLQLRMSAQGLEHGKPHPAVFLQTARTLEVEAPDCVVFQDSMLGVVAAKATRMACVAVPDGH